MCGYVIVRVRDQKYLAPEGSKFSYTNNLERARRFGSLESAQGNALGDERVRSVEGILDSGGRL